MKSKYWQVAAVRELMQQNGFKNHLYVDRRATTVRIKVVGASTKVIRELFPLCQELAANSVDIQFGEFLMWFSLTMTKSRAKVHNKIFTLMMTEKCEEKFKQMEIFEKERYKEYIIRERERLQDKIVSAAETATEAHEAVIEANTLLTNAIKAFKEFDLANS